MAGEFGFEQHYRRVAAAMQLRGAASVRPAESPQLATLANLAGACGQQGRFGEAIPLAEQALQLARTQGQDALADQIEAGLDSYRQQAAAR